jgi:hypothetical protein
VGAYTVIDSGLVAGERVVTDGQSRLVAGAKVNAQLDPNVAPAEATPKAGS